MKIYNNQRCSLPKAVAFVTMFVIVLISGYSANAQKQENWGYFCEKTKKGQACGIRQVLIMRKMVDGKNKTVGRLISAVVQKIKQPKGGSIYLINLLLPLGTNLKAGMKMAVDSGPESLFDYSKCTTQGCLVLAQGSKKLIRAMKRGKILKIAFLPFNSPKSVVVSVPLDGFTKNLQKLK